ncbi:MAG: molybdopterin-guanine dinucleotide biosynthesis protein B [Candidatus Omnitrophota bacterium]|jgi:molybdopterin-guanine dinucleotide biosynthesis protein B
MDKKYPFILSIIGIPDSGKTTLILRLLPELKKRGISVAVAKHCPRGFDLDIEGKDSFKFAQAGSKGIFLSSTERETVIRPYLVKPNLKEKLKNYFSDFDYVLMEGYNNEMGIKKIQIIRKEIGGKESSLPEIIAYISDKALTTDKPVYQPDDITGIASFLESLKNESEI